MTDELIVRQEGSAGRLTLNRRRALNAVSLDMVHGMLAALESWQTDETVRVVIVDGAGERGLCAGGDIRALYKSGQEQDGVAQKFWADEYKLNALIANYPKPYVAIMDGIVMGGGVGVSVHGSHRIATEKTLFAMPETGIGLFPDVGGTYFLPRLPGELGMFMALTGARLKGPDALYAGIATHYVPSGRLVALEEALSSTDDVEEVLKGFSAECDVSGFDGLQAQIDGHFSKDSVEAIVKSLKKDKSDWAAKQLSIMATKSPVRK